MYSASSSLLVLMEHDSGSHTGGWKATTWSVQQRRQKLQLCMEKNCAYWESLNGKLFTLRCGAESGRQQRLFVARLVVQVTLEFAVQAAKAIIDFFQNKQAAFLFYWSIVKSFIYTVRSWLSHSHFWSKFARDSTTVVFDGSWVGHLSRTFL